MNAAQTVINYCLNRFCPPLLLGALIFPHFELTEWKLYAIIGLMFFMDRFQYKVGYSVGYCEGHGIDPTKPPIIPKKNIHDQDDSVDDR